MLAAAMDALLSPLFSPAQVRFVALRLPVSVGDYSTSSGVLFPVETSVPLLGAGDSVPVEDLAAGAMYVLCYRPAHKDADAFRQLACAYVKRHSPEFPARLAAAARLAMVDGDWVGTIGRLWTIVQLCVDAPEPLDELAMACFQFGFAEAQRGEHHLAVKLGRAAGAALNSLHVRFPRYGPGHLHRAEFVAAAGNVPSALQAVRDAIRLGLPPELADDAYALQARLISLPNGAAGEKRVT